MKSLTDQQDFEIDNKMLQFVFVRILSACQTEKKNADFKQTKNVGSSSGILLPRASKFTIE